jgi:hypothetical protein
MQESDPPINEDYNLPPLKKGDEVRRKNFREPPDPVYRHYAEKGGHFERGKHDRFLKELARNTRKHGDDAPGR